MDRYIEIYQTLDIAELEIIKSTLNHHEIEFTVYDENTLYSSNVYAMGLSGARIMVDKNMHTEAMGILIDLIPEKFRNQSGKTKAQWILDLERKKNSISVLKNVPLPFILIGLVVILVAIISIFLLNS